QFGYHIIKVTEKKEAGKVPFDEVKDQIENYLTQQKRSEYWEKYRTQMHSEAKIEYSPEEKALREKAAAAPSPRQIQPQTQGQPQPEKAQPQQAPSGEIKPKTEAKPAETK
ncbi:MAG: hypothetical protein ABFC95_00510, partial [Smithella sp.]